MPNYSTIPGECHKQRTQQQPQLLTVSLNHQIVFGSFLLSCIIFKCHIMLHHFDSSLFWFLYLYSLPFVRPTHCFYNLIPYLICYLNCIQFFQICHQEIFWSPFFSTFSAGIYVPFVGISLSNKFILYPFPPPSSLPVTQTSILAQ